MGHSAYDVAFCGYAVNHEGLAGQHDNIEVPEFVAKQLDLKLDPITPMFRKNAFWIKGNVKL